MTNPTHNPPSLTGKKERKGRSRFSGSQKLLHGPDSTLLPAVRKLHQAANKITSGVVDQEALDKLQGLREDLIQQVPLNAVDALFILGTLRSVASFHFLHTEIEIADDGATLEREMALQGFAEILIATNSLRQFLEGQAGFSLESLGLFQDAMTIQ